MGTHIHGNGACVREMAISRLGLAVGVGTVLKICAYLLLLSMADDADIQLSKHVNDAALTAMMMKRKIRQPDCTGEC